MLCRAVAATCASTQRVRKLQDVVERQLTKRSRADALKVSVPVTAAAGHDQLLLGLNLGKSFVSCALAPAPAPATVVEELDHWVASSVISCACDASSRVDTCSENAVSESFSPGLCLFYASQESTECACAHRQGPHCRHRAQHTGHIARQDGRRT